MPLTPQEVDCIASRAAEAIIKKAQDDMADVISETVRQTLMQLGVDTNSPIEMQRDFQHLREWRKVTGELKQKGLLALLGIFVSGAVAAFFIGVKFSLR